MLIAQISDLHIRPEGEKANRVVDTNRMARDCVDHILGMEIAPDVVLATGDLADRGTAAEYAVLRDILAPLPMPVYLIPGNHDDRAAMRDAFPDDAYLTQDGEFLHYAIDDHPVRLIGLDTLVPGKGHGELCQTRLDWLDARLEERRGHPVVIFMHHPPFPTGLAAMDSINCRNGAALEALVMKHPNVERVLAGHHHRPIQIRWAGTIGSVAPSPAHQVHLNLDPASENSRLIMEPPGFHLHVWQAGAGLMTHMVYVGAFDGPYNFGG